MLLALLSVVALAAVLGLALGLALVSLQPAEHEPRLLGKAASLQRLAQHAHQQQAQWVPATVFLLVGPQLPCPSPLTLPHQGRAWPLVMKPNAASCAGVGVFLLQSYHELQVWWGRMTTVLGPQVQLPYVVQEYVYGAVEGRIHAHRPATGAGARTWSFDPLVLKWVGDASTVAPHAAHGLLPLPPAAVGMPGVPEAASAPVRQRRHAQGLPGTAATPAARRFFQVQLPPGQQVDLSALLSCAFPGARALALDVRAPSVEAAASLSPGLRILEINGVMGMHHTFMAAANPAFAFFGDAVRFGARVLAHGLPSALHDPAAAWHRLRCAVREFRHHRRMDAVHHVLASLAPGKGAAALSPARHW